MTTYIVVTDVVRARIFRQEGSGAMQEADTLVHPESHMHAGDLRTGGKGEVHEFTMTTAHQPGNEQDTIEKLAEFFAREVAAYLGDLRIGGEAERFILVAEPRFLGLLRTKLDEPTAKMVARTVNRDYSRASSEDIAEELTR